MTTLSRVALLAGMALACPGTALAMDFTPDTTRYLSDPSFLPLAGQVFSETTYNSTHVDEDWFGQGATVSGEHYAASGNHYIETLLYGISDRLSIEAVGEYDHSTFNYSFMFQGPLRTTRSQFADPTFGATYRLIDQTESPVSVDANASFTPAIVDDEPASGSIGLAVSQEMRSLTLQLEAATGYAGSYESIGTLYGSTNDIGGHWNFSLAARSQIRINPQLAINTGITYAKSLGYSVSSPFEIVYNGVISVHTLKYTERPDGTVSPFVALAYDIVPGQVNLAFEYDHLFIGDDHLGGATNGSWLNQSENLYAVHLRLLF
jgi:hypothetical protein